MKTVSLRVLPGVHRVHGLLGVHVSSPPESGEAERGSAKAELLSASQFPSGWQELKNSSFSSAGAICPIVPLLTSSAVAQAVAFYADSGFKEIFGELIVEQSGPASSVLSAASRAISACKSVSPVASPLSGITSYAWHGAFLQGSAKTSVSVALAAKGTQVLLVELQSIGPAAQGLSFGSFAGDAAAKLP